MNRRNFIKNTAVTGVGYGVFPFIAKQPTRLTTAIVGSGWWGMNIARVAIEAGHSVITAVCDVDERNLFPAIEEIEKLTGKKPKAYKDYRELIKKEKPAIVINATPDHWHPLVTIEAVQNGADVYVEKPIGHTINEGKAMVKAARQYKRIVQVGTHRRVSPHNISGMDFLKSGKAGKIGMVRSFVHYGGGAGKITPDAEPPKELDWDMWCGPAPFVPYNPTIHPKGFRQYLDFANGQLGDWGMHWMDQILWWTEEKGPKRIFSTAARHIKTDQTTAPDTQVVNFEFESFTATWEHRQYAANNAEKSNIGCYFYGTEGTFHMGWLDGWTFYPADDKKSIIHQDPTLHTVDHHNIKELWANFVASIRSRNLPVCDIEIGHRSTNMCLLGMLSHKHGKSIDWDPDKEIIIGDNQASKLLQRDYRAPWKYPV